MESKLTERAEKMLSDREQEIVRKALEKATGVDVESEVGDVRYHAGNSDFAFDGGGDTMLYVGYYEDDPKPYTVSIENMSGQQIAMEDAKDYWLKVMDVWLDCNYFSTEVDKKKMREQFKKIHASF